MKGIVLLALLVLLVMPLAVHGEDPTRGGASSDERELPLRFGIGFDFFAMDQPYSIQSLKFSAPGLALPPVSTSGIGVQNEIQHKDVKIDFWVLPFLNVFGILGKVDGTTTVDLSSAGLPLPIREISIDIDGKVYGGGATAALGSERFFGSLTTALTSTSLKGEFDSSLKTISLQPRAGIHGRHYQAWLGGLYLNTEEKHSGSIPISLGGPQPIPVEFDVMLEDKHPFSPMIGGAYHFNRHFSLTVEGGFGERQPLLANLTCRL